MSTNTHRGGTKAHLGLAVERWMYRGGRPNELARSINRLSSMFFGTRLVSSRYVRLHVRGRRSGRDISFPVVAAARDGQLFLVSMLGERSNWVRNVRAADGSAVLYRKGLRMEVRLEEVEPGERAPIIQRYLAVAPKPRAFIPSEASAEGSETAVRAIPVFRVRVTSTPMRRSTGPGSVLRRLRRSSVGGAVEYVGQLVGGLIHPELLRSGATLEEERRPLPGDHLVANPNWEATRGVSIDAPAASVWPWVAQMGFGRGGFYGWNPLEREDTGVFRLLEEVVPPNVGDVWLDGPGCDETKGAWRVREVKPPHTLVLYTLRDPVTGRELDPQGAPRLFIDTVWSFHLVERSARETRLLARSRIRVGPRWALLALKWMGAGDTVMQRRLLDGIKARVEAAAEPAEPMPERSQTARTGIAARPGAES